MPKSLGFWVSRREKDEMLEILRDKIKQTEVKGCCLFKQNALTYLEKESLRAFKDWLDGGKDMTQSQAQTIYQMMGDRVYEYEHIFILICNDLKLKDIGIVLCERAGYHGI